MGSGQVYSACERLTLARNVCHMIKAALPAMPRRRGTSVRQELQA